MQLDSTVTFALIVAVISLISPMITTYLSNKHDLKVNEIKFKQKKYEQNDLYVKRMFDNFVQSFGEVMEYPQANNQKRFGKYYFSCLNYVPKKDYETFVEFYDIYKSLNDEVTVEFFTLRILPITRSIIKSYENSETNANPESVPLIKRIFGK
ncbi:hypothetical protein ACQUFO_10310 [Enterococcus casseliflavus]|uniref:hypothetical protein n=1 Tax=Enterococcus casseliflavus TaxID=37734 RepID=UPI003D0D1EBD